MVFTGRDIGEPQVRDPLPVIMDGAPGLLKAVKRVWPHAYRQ
jgi:hypothetical protein